MIRLAKPDGFGLAVALICVYYCHLSVQIMPMNFIGNSPLRFVCEFMTSVILSP